MPAGPSPGRAVRGPGPLPPPTKCPAAGGGRWLTGVVTSRVCETDRPGRIGYLDRPAAGDVGRSDKRRVLAELAVEYS